MKELICVVYCCVLAVTFCVIVQENAKEAQLHLPIHADVYVFSKSAEFKTENDDKPSRFYPLRLFMHDDEVFIRVELEGKAYVQQIDKGKSTNAFLIDDMLRVY